MPCYYPMEAVRFRDDTIKITGHLENGFHSKMYTNNLNVKEFLSVPCGKCIGCRLEYSRQWAIRCMNELKYTVGQSWFLTITYDNEHLPRMNYVEEASGVTVGMPTLKPKDLQDFFKRLRERIRRAGGGDIRYYACGEYGEQLKRPHYHAIVYNLNLDDLDYYKSIRGHDYYNSKFLDDVWGNRGFVVASDVNFEACAYVARYVMKKAKGPQGFSYASDNGLVEEFVRMSRRPGIGRQFYEDHKEKMYLNDFMGFYPTQNGPIKLKPVKYYDKLFDVDEHETMELIKKRRREEAKRANELLMSQTSVSSSDYRAILEREKQSKAALLKRDYE